MPIRSWLFVPGDSEHKLAKASGTGADAIIIDLEDAVANEAKPQARALAAQWLAAHRQKVVSGEGLGRWVRINSLETTHWRTDLAQTMPSGPDGIIVPKAAVPDQLQALAAELYELEQRNHIAPGSTRIIPMVGETAAAALTIGAFAQSSNPRLAGLTWGAEDLANSIGASRKRDEQGNWTDLFRMVRTQVLLTARARNFSPIDTLFDDFRDLAGLRGAAVASFADGFTGMLAIHPDQVPVINLAFTPDPAAIARAQAIVDIFSNNQGAGALQLDGCMIEQPHLEQARRLLERYG